MMYFSGITIISERYQSCLSKGVKYSDNYGCVAENSAGTVGRDGPICEVTFIKFR